MGVSRDVLDDAISLSQGASVGDNIFHMPIPPHSLPIPAPFISAPVHSFPFQHVPLQQIPMHQLPIPIQPQHQIHPFHFVHQQHNPFQQQQQHQNQNQQQSPKKHARKRRQTKQQQQQDEDQAERRRLLAAYNSYTNPNPPIVAPMYPAIGSFSSSTTYPIFPRRPSYSNSTPPPPAIPPPNVPKPPVETSVEPETIDEVKNVETDATKKDDAVKKEDETKQDGLSLLEKLRASLRASKLTVKESQPTTLRRAQMHRERQLDVENRRDEVMEDGEITIKTGGQSGSEKNRSGSGSDMDISDDEKALKVGAEVEKKNESDSSMDTDSSSEDESGSASDSSDSSDDSEEDPAAKAKNWRERIFATQKTQLNGSSASLDASAVVLETPSIELSPQPTPAVSVAPSTVSETSPPPVSAPSAVVVLAPATTAVPKPSARPRPSASDLNLRPPPMQQHRPTGPSKKFIPHKSYHNFVIEVSDSSSDDEPAPPPGPTRQQLLEEKIREMKERIAEKEREKREKMGKESVSETGTPVVVHSSIPSFNLPAVESKPVFPQHLPLLLQKRQHPQHHQPAQLHTSILKSCQKPHNHHNPSFPLQNYPRNQYLHKGNFSNPPSPSAKRP
ncbi:hypothetical protein BCR33DRAFT_197481 [Rhizoclosmatium globosum]|uniref:Uncharacterized protein n=1 Tax=Rhizoclosmatium globosum TaxID=329046 RepID=A0A1Y2CDW7_9FUNG|nr:hypothetical protein BCR33DRAFT_197481 [Rhizoclosmatium globosum]|eukprot:ORY45260.1 hypothetical protein BCR33DRAFT_197481 [Rhizoclosmatium globosum]